MAESFPIRIDDTASVTGLIYQAGKNLRLGVTLILGHGAGANQTHRFMVSFATELAARGLDVVTFNFGYTERGRGAPDPTAKLEECYRAAINSARSLSPLKMNRLVIGGKSMGGRIASRVAADGVADLAGLVFLGYPLHPPGKPESLRTSHLPRVKAPMLFVQGTRDTFGTPDELRPIIDNLKLPATVYEVAGGDHSFAVLKRSPTPQEQVFTAARDAIVEWITSVTADPRSA